MHSLLLYCEEPLWRPASPNHVVRTITDAGLVGEAEDDDAFLFRAGEQFLSLITFLGCSPQVSMAEDDAVDGQPVCRIRLHDFEDVHLLESRPAPALRCVACRALQQRPLSLEFDRQQTCVKCGESALLHQFDWRRGAGFGQFFVEIENVFPHEAVPADGLISVLEQQSGSRWNYFYLSR